jgi:hypothetical protein
MYVRHVCTYAMYVLTPCMYAMYVRRGRNAHMQRPPTVPLVASSAAMHVAAGGSCSMKRPVACALWYGLHSICIRWNEHHAKLCLTQHISHGVESIAAAAAQSSTCIALVPGARPGAS